MARLQNKVALITGAASGIGLACAQRYASEGAVVIGTDIQDRDDWCSLVGGDPENALYKLDVTDGAAQKAIADDLITRFGRIDILLTAAGVGAGGPINMLDEDAWDKVVDVNLKGTFLSIKAVIDQMMAQRSGSIITIASVEGTLEGATHGCIGLLHRFRNFLHAVVNQITVDAELMTVLVPKRCCKLQ